MNVWGYTEILPHLQGLSHHILGKLFDCNNYEFLDLKRTRYFIEKISTSFEVEKIQAFKQTLVWVKYWRKFLQMEDLNTFSKNSVYFKIIQVCPSYKAYHFFAFCTFWEFFDILKMRYNDILWQCWNFL